MSGPVFSLDRVISADQLADIDAEYHHQFQPGVTVEDVIRSMAGIGYGGHFDEMSDDEASIYWEIARTQVEYQWISEIRRCYMNRIRDLIEAAPW